MKQYYISIDGQPQGPFTLEQLATHGLKATSMIWNEEMPDWRLASTVASVRDFLPKLPPPHRTPPPLVASAATFNKNKFPPPIQPTHSVSGKGIAPIAGANNKKGWFVGGGAVVVAMILMTVFNHRNSSNESAYMPSAMATGGENLVANTAPTGKAMQEQELAAAEQRAAEKAAEAEEKEAKRSWNKKHLIEYMAVNVLPGYTHRLIGGVSEGYCEFTNKSGYRLQNIVLDVEYVKSNGETYTTKQVNIGKISAQSTSTVQFPSCERGVRVMALISHFEAPGLEYTYDAQGEADAMTAQEDARAAEKGGY